MQYKTMTSVARHYAQIPPNALFVNIADARSSIVGIDLSTVSWATLQNVPGLSTAGSVLLRDMGKTVYLSNENILRKIQLVTPTSVSESADGSYYTGYILHGNANGVPSKFARAN